MHVFHASNCTVFLRIYILQGSVVRQLRCGGIFNNQLIANCLENVPVKEF